ncbi:hypothetical protein SAMN04489724_3538 [Algoriphagus locisalis]|uniref:Glycoside hydrolase n=2 Tax=Algoriphagus locisalis TaxID=305507 RepID=A0A1I7CX28_9BACT|nr:hypothetical protein SAMN04489724_3538 [Algoriphagus locisalis]
MCIYLINLTCYYHLTITYNLKPKELMKTLMLIALFMVSFVTAATDVTGRWTGTIMDQFEVVYNFTQDGETVGGTTVGPDGSTIKIANGVIKGDEISFTIDVMGGDLPIKGKVDGDTMKLTFTMEGNEMPFELKKDAKK